MATTARAVASIAVVLLIAGVGAAQVVEPPSSDPTPTPTPEAEDPAGTETADPKEVALDPDASQEEVAEALLDPYPEQAEMGAKEKFGIFRDSLRGLLVWDFFDGRLTVRGHGRIQVDGTLADGNSTFTDIYGEANDSIEFRRLEVFAQGTIDDHIRYSASFNFGTDPGFGEVFIEGRHEGLRLFGYYIGQFRLGLFQEPFSFERVMSSYYTGFVERSLPVWTFSPGNNVGYMLHDTLKNQRFSWSVGFFSFGKDDETNQSNSVLSVTARATVLPIYRDDGRRLLHFGASVSTRDPKGSSARYRSRPEARFVDFVVDTGDFDSGRIKLVGLEAVGIKGPLSFQSELIVSQVEGTPYGDLSFWGGYVEVGYFLTGEHRTYDTQLGVFSRMQPKTSRRSGLIKGGFGGGWEVTGRISNVDLDDGEVRGGSVVDLSLGLNWYLSATSIVKLNYIHANVEDRGRANILVLRYQFRPLPIPGWR